MVSGDREAKFIGSSAMDDVVRLAGVASTSGLWAGRTSRADRITGVGLGLCRVVVRVCGVHRPRRRVRSPRQWPIHQTAGRPW